MKYDKAIKIAVQALEQECRRLAPQANLVEFYKADAPSSQAAYSRRKELREAIEALGQRVFS